MFKNLLVGAALTLSTLALASPPMHAASPAGLGSRVGQEVRADVRDVSQGRHLLRELEESLARRDLRAVARLDGRIDRYLEGQVAEARQERAGARDRHERREERGNARELARLLSSFRRVEGSFDRRALRERRFILADALALAERDLRDDRGERLSRR